MNIRKIKINRKILIISILIAIPVIALFIYGAYSAGKHAEKVHTAIGKTLPAALAYAQLERNIMKMQKWLTHISATRGEKEYDSGFREADKYNDAIDYDFERLNDIFKEDPENLMRLSQLYSSIENYYDVGMEVAKTYIEDGTSTGNAMLDVFTIIDTEINNTLTKYTGEYTEEVLEMNKSVEYVLNNTKIVFFTMTLLTFILAIAGYMLMVKKEEVYQTHLKISKTIDALWIEMQLAKKIQTVLLPKKPAIKGYHITGHMITAEDIGGDYYDVINVKGKDWMVIGEVSGYGVSAGLVMMMVQTSILTVLKRYPDIPPAKLLAVINNVIADNIKKLGEDKFVTATVLDVNGEGKISFSGLNQDILIHRKTSQTVERIETQGMWLGILESLEEMNKNDSFQLYTGDIILLYTDGLISSVDKDDNVFSQKKLMNVFAELSLNNGNVEHIKEGILKELETYSNVDDVTMMVVKME